MGAYADAVAEFRSAIREDATYAHAHAMLAVTIYLSAQVQRDHSWAEALVVAERSAQRALEIDPTEPKGCNIMGQILDWQGRHEEAGAFLERAVSLNPSFALASTARSYHAVMTGAFEAAKTYIRTAMRLRVSGASKNDHHGEQEGPDIGDLPICLRRLTNSSCRYPSRHSDDVDIPSASFS